MTEISPIDSGKVSRFLDEYAVELLQTYFNSGEYTGGRFERFGGGGDSPETAERFTSDDVVAASFLGVRLSGRAAIEILDDDAGEYCALLSQVPVDVDLWSAPDDVVGPDSPAEELWSRLAQLPGVSRMAAGKLLARKRPRLIPVYDRVLRAEFDRKEDDDWWRALRATLSARPALVKSLEEVRQQSGLEEISVLRVIHVSIWMRSFGRPESAPDAES